MLTEDQAKTLIASAIPDIQEALKSKAIQHVTHQMDHRIAEAVFKEVDAFVAAEVAPKVREALLEGKDGILAATANGAAEIAASLQVTFVDVAKQRLADTWKRREILKALFGER